MKGYYTNYSYYGYVDGKYIPFVSEIEYIEFLKER